jgi:hypothetical protein
VSFVFCAYISAAYKKITNKRINFISYVIGVAIGLHPCMAHECKSLQAAIFVLQLNTPENEMGMKKEFIFSIS